MRVLVGQPLHEQNTEQLENELKANKKIDVVIFPEGYLYNEKAVESARRLAEKFAVTIITSYRKENKDRALIINSFGEIVLERAKTPPQEETRIYEPTTVKVNGIAIGYLLCMEILKGARDLRHLKDRVSFIVHPIGVGMFSEKQFEEWINEARNIAVSCNTMVMGTSHADGSYRNCGVSIPISYCIDEKGKAVYISKADTRTRIIDVSTKEVIVNGEAADR